MGERIDYDVIVVGGGPAGLSAATVLGRCLRRVLVCDAGNPRNARACGVHAFLTRDGARPGELAQIAREQMARYGVEFRETTVMHVRREGDAFAVELLDGTELRGRKVLLATGVVDKIPAIPGIEELYGKSVHHCPYCDGWEHRGEALAVYGRGHHGARFAVEMKAWSDDVALCTNGASRLKDEDRQRLARHGVTLYQQRILRLEGELGSLRRIIFSDGKALARDALFLSMANVQRSEIPRELGCELNAKGGLKKLRGERSSVPGVFVAGDASEDSQLVVVAAAEGAKAAMAIHTELQREEVGL